MYTWIRSLVFTKNRSHRIISYDEAQAELTGRVHRAVPPAQILSRADESVGASSALPPGDREG